MHVRDLVEVAGVVALNGPLIVRRAESLSQTHLEQYWTTSKCRCENWHRALKYFAPAADERSRQDFDNCMELRSTLDEIFVSELLTRVWCAVLVAHDRQWQMSVDEHLARSVLISHMEARHRALALLLDTQGFSMREALAINRLRRRTERWSDVLIGGLLGEADVREFAVDTDRAIDFAADLDRRRASPGGRQAWRLTLVSLRNAFQKGLCPIAANPDANARITASILGCFPDELFDSTGLLQSLWMMRLSTVASDAQGMIEDLLRPDPQVDTAWRGGLSRRRPR
jgi:hypothetical protein